MEHLVQYYSIVLVHLVLCYSIVLVHLVLCHIIVLNRHRLHATFDKVINIRRVETGIGNLKIFLFYSILGCALPL